MTMSKKPKPHVSAALAHLRPGVTLSAMALTVCVIAQLLVFGFTHFTEMRYATPEVHAPTTEQPLSVVPSVRVEPRRDPNGGSGATQAAPETEAAAPAPPRQLSGFDVILRYTSNLASAMGVASAAALWVLVFLGVVVAGGASVPGVEKAVSACTWGLVLALLCLPWKNIVPTAPFPGVFSDYGVMTAASEATNAGRASAAALLGTYLVLPVAALLGAMLVLGRFRAGVAAGIIIQSVSELDKAIEREAEDIARRGISVSGPRAVGALNAAIGASSGMAGEQQIRRRDEESSTALAGPARIADGLPRAAPTRDRRFKQQQDEEDDDYRRPI